MTKNLFIGFMAGIGAGAATMYFLDPDRGCRRRALVTDKVTAASRKLTRAVEVTKRDISNRSYGMLMEARHLFGSEAVPDDVLEARIRSKMGRNVSNPHAVQVTCQNGNVRLSGSVLANESASLLRRINAVPGVSSVENNMDELPGQEAISQAAQKKSTDQPAEKLGRNRPQAIH
jgi:BON domain